MCIPLSGRAAYCKCTHQIPDNTLTRMCDFALMKNRTLCQMVNFPDPDACHTDPVCPRCSRAGHITIYISPWASKRRSKGRRDQYHIKDIHSELRAQLAEALEYSVPSAPLTTTLDDRALVEAVKDATSFAMIGYEDGALKDAAGFVMVEHEDGSEQWDEKGAPPPTPENHEFFAKRARRGKPIVDQSNDFGMALE
jgi:hypothetical protein